MIAVAVLASFAAIGAASLFAYSLYRFFATGGWLFWTTVPWPSVPAHLLRAVGFLWLAWKAGKLAGSIDRIDGSADASFPTWNRSFWTTAAVTLTLFAGLWTFEKVHLSIQDPRNFFFPAELQSGYVAIQKDRIQFRRASETPVQGWEKMEYRGGASSFFVSPEVEVSGDDIELAVVRIGEVFPGAQATSVDIQFTPSGAEKIRRLTTEHLTKPVAVLLDGQLRSAPRVFTPISKSSQLTGFVTPGEAALMIRRGDDKMLNVEFDDH